MIERATVVGAKRKDVRCGASLQRGLHSTDAVIQLGEHSAGYFVGVELRSVVELDRLQRRLKRR